MAQGKAPIAQEAAEAHAATIRQYWRGRGYNVQVEVVTNQTHNGLLYQIRSNLGPTGMPPAAVKSPWGEAA